jgi:phage terminase Nu1 subunit (DNA packaging protein)
VNLNYKLSDVAKALSLTTRRIQQLVKNDILPAPVNGNYDLVSCIRAYEKYLQQQNPSKNNNNLHTQKLRLLKAQADKAELEVAILEDKYLAVSEVELTWSNLLLAFRARILGLPNNLARQLISLNNDFAAVSGLLEKEIHIALLELSNYSGEEDNKLL